MNKKKQKIRIEIIISSIFILALATLVFLNRYETNQSIKRVKSEGEWVDIWNSDKNNFTQIAKDFYSSEYSLIQYQNGDNDFPCDKKTVSKCNPYFLKGNTDLYKNGLLLETDNQFSQFMKNYNIMFLTKEKYPSDNIEFSSGNFGKCGLKYFLDEADFVEDSEYPKVTKISNNWYYFCQDWN